MRELIFLEVFGSREGETSSIFTFGRVDFMEQACKPKTEAWFSGVTLREFYRACRRILSKHISAYDLRHAFAMAANRRRRWSLSRGTARRRSRAACTWRTPPAGRTLPSCGAICPLMDKKADFRPGAVGRRETTQVWDVHEYDNVLCPSTGGVFGSGKRRISLSCQRGVTLWQFECRGC